MAKWVCSVCGYVYEGEAAPAVCPVCKAPAEKFIKQDETMSWAAEHVVALPKVFRKISSRIFVQTSRASALRLVCTWLCPESLTERLS